MCSHSTSGRLSEQAAPTLVRIYFKTGPAKTLLFRSPPGADCTSCVLHPERRLARWLLGATAAQPGFPNMIRAIYVHEQREPCAACQEQLLRFLDTYRLADRLRFVIAETPAQGCSCGCRNAPDEVLAGDDWEGELTPNQKSAERKEARKQARTKGFTPGPGLQIDHGIPLAQSHRDPRASANPNRYNLRAVTTRAHQEKEKMWNDYVHRTFYQHCTTAEQRRRKLTDIFAQLRKKYPQDTISRAFGKEIELLELAIF